LSFSAVRLQAGLCLQMVQTNAVVLCRQDGIGLEAGTFERRR
jgi:hypothetical protein